MVPEWLRRRKPTGPEILVYVTLGSYGTFNPGAGTYEECRPAVPTIAEETDLSENTVRKALKGLADHGALVAGAPRYDDRGGQLPTVYRLVFGQLVAPPQNLNPPGSTVEGEGVQKDTPGGVPKSEPNQEPPTKNPDTKPSASQRGTRLPDDWKPSAKLGEWLLSKLPEGQWSDHSRQWAIHCTEKFTLYWHSKAGAAGRHLDWDKTWQRWMLTELERYRPAAAGLKTPPAGGQFKTSVEKNADRHERAMVRAHLVEAVMEQGATFDQAVALVDPELKRREALGEVIRMDACPVISYIEGGLIETTREVTA